MDRYEARAAALDAELAKTEGLAIAYSGGVDSAVLLHAATRVLGERALGVIADSPSLPRRELEAARAFAESIGARLVVVGTDEARDPRYVRNDASRCYWCKEALFDAVERVAECEGVAAIAYGENSDDGLDDRPGRRSASEHGVLAPLAAAGFTKDDVRRYAREHGLEVADKPASACLASRIPRGTSVTPERLARVEAAEAALAELGLRVLRVRHHGEHARVEVGAEERERAEALGPAFGEALARAGFTSHELAIYRPPAKRADA